MDLFALGYIKIPLSPSSC